MTMTKQEETLLKELLTKYKQGFISGLIPGDGIIFSSNNCRNKTISSIGGGSGTETDPIFQSWLNSQNPQSGKFLISGGTTWSGDDFVYYVSDLTYFFNGNKSANNTQITLDNPDVTYNRFDVVVVDEVGVISVIKGTAEANPVIPEIPDTQLIVSTILVEAGTVQPNISQENIYLDDPTGSWTLSTYTTGAPTGTLVFNGTTTPKEGVNHIQANADQRLGARFVRTTSFDAFQYTILQVWVRFTGTNVDSNKSLNVRFENSAGVLVGNTLNLFNYGIQRNILNTWQLAVIPITAFGSLPSTVKGFRAIMIGGTVGVTRQWDMDWILLSDSSVPNVEVPKINFYKDDNVVGSQSGLNLKAGTNIGITAVNDVINNRVEYVVDALGGGGGSFETKTKAEIIALIGSNSLVPGTLYKITGVHGNSATLGALENDGITDGVTVFLKALTNNTLEKAGVGIFHSPIRDMSHWNSKVFQTWIKLDGFGSTIRPDETITADNGATGVLKIAEDVYSQFVLIEPLTGDWTTAASFVGDLSAGSFNITSYTLPLGSTIGDKVLWGNYVWTNTTGVVGSIVDDRTLDSNWTKVAYNNTDYVTMYNYCEFDLTQNWITRRVDDKGNDVKFLFPIGYSFSAIAVFEWNNGVDYMQEYYGCFLNNLEFSYVANCNLWKHTFNMNTLKNTTITSDNRGNKINIANNNMNQCTIKDNTGNVLSLLYNNLLECEVEDNRASSIAITNNDLYLSSVQLNIGAVYFLQYNKGKSFNLVNNIGSGIGMLDNYGEGMTIDGNTGSNIFIKENSGIGFSVANNTVNAIEVKGNIGNSFNLNNNQGTSDFSLNNNKGNDYTLSGNNGNNYYLTNNVGNNLIIVNNTGDYFNMDKVIGNDCMINANTGNNYSISTTEGDTDLYGNTGNYYQLSNNQGGVKATNNTNANGVQILYNTGSALNISENNFDSNDFTFKDNKYTELTINGNSNIYIINGTIENTTFESNTQINVDLSTSTVIKASYSKRVFKRPDGTLKIVHFDNTDTQVINDITD